MGVRVNVQWLLAMGLWALLFYIVDIVVVSARQHVHIYVHIHTSVELCLRPWMSQSATASQTTKGENKLFNNELMSIASGEWRSMMY